jgi:ABC-type Zn uptake system ZnuABC Zn-binding protein ZnuA
MRMSRSKRLCIIGFGSLLMLVVAYGCGTVKIDDGWPADKKPKVLASFPPVYCFALNVAGDDAHVQTLLTTTGPHDYQPSSRDNLKLRRADLFFINGLALDEKFAEQLQSNSDNPNLPLIELGERVPNKIALGHEKEEKEEGARRGSPDPADHHHHHGAFDPHVWLGIPEAIVMVEAIRDELKAIDPDHAAGYDKRAADYVAKLKQLQADGQDALRDVKPAQRKLIAFHDSLRYFARSFGVEIAGVMEVRPGVPPDPHQFKQLVETCRKDDIRVIAVEPQYSADAAKRLIEGTGMKDMRVIEIDPMETALAEDFDAAHEHGRDLYERKMKANIDQLRRAWK